MNIADNETQELEELIAFADELQPNVPDIFMCTLEGYEGRHEAIAARNAHTNKYTITAISAKLLKIEVNACVVRSRYLSAYYYEHDPEFYYG